MISPFWVGIAIQMQLHTISFGFRTLTNIRDNLHLRCLTGFWISIFSLRTTTCVQLCHIGSHIGKKIYVKLCLRFCKILLYFYNFYLMNEHLFSKLLRRKEIKKKKKKLCMWFKTEKSAATLSNWLLIRLMCDLT